MTPNGCPTLPSAQTAHRFARGEPVALLVARDVLVRAAVVSVGLALAGRPRRRLAREALITSAAIEAFVLVHAALTT